MDLTPKQQTSEAIRQAETILILTGQHPSVDQAAAVVALTMILRKFGKNATAIITDSPSPALNVLDTRLIEKTLGGTRDFVLKVDVTKAQVDTLRYEAEGSKLNIYLTPRAGTFAPSDVTFDYGEANMNYDLAIVLGVPTRVRIDRAYEQNAEFFASIPTINLDFHRSNENYGAVNLIEPNASSLCEMLVALSESLQSGIIDADIATALLMGIVASTDRFTAAHTSPKSLTVAAQMMAAGAKQQTVVRALYRDGRSDGRSDRPASGERTAERTSERTGERRPERTAPASAPARTAQPQNQPQAQAQPAPQSAPQPRQQSEAVPAPRTEIRTEPRAEAKIDAPAAHPEVREEPSDLPIIQPGHIELSEPEIAPSQSSAQRPQVYPMADFAAASEMFSRVEPADEKDLS